MKKIMFIMISIFAIAYINSESIGSSKSIVIKQNGNEVNVVNNEFIIKNSYFSIELANITRETNVHIFISRNEIIKETVGVNLKNSKFFSVASSIALPRDYIKDELVLYFDSLRVNNVISEDMRKFENGKTIINISGFANLDNSNIPISKLFVALFFDLNTNNIIDDNEIAYLILQITGTGTLFNKKIYISTSGYWIKNINLEQANNYRLYKITSFEGLDKYKKEITGNISNLEFWIDNNKLFDEYNIYILQSPTTMDLFLDQPYKYSNERYLIFDIISSPVKKNYYYIAGRNYFVEKNNDNLTILVNNNGIKIIPDLFIY